MTDGTDVVAHQRMIMGLPFSIHIRPPFDATRARSAVTAVWKELFRYDHVFSTYRPDSDVCRLERGELALGDADPWVREMLDLAEEARWITNGAFNIRITGRLDPSGLVKGWAAERSFARLFELNADFYGNAGGDVLLHSPSGRPWRVGIEHPRETKALMAAVDVASGAVATSGRSHRGAHIAGPDGLAARGVLQATIIGPTLTWSDVLATAVVADGHTMPDTSRWPAGYEVLLVNDENQVAASPGAITALAITVPAPPVHYRFTRSGFPAGPLAEELTFTPFSPPPRCWRHRRVI